MRVASVFARQLLDCKARPLVEVEITTNTGHVGRGASPTGTSVGVPLGKYWRSRPLVFSFDPRCHGELPW